MTSEAYDYAIVGAGTAGCVLASRLSEDPDVRVLLIEAGTADGPPAMADPSAWRLLQGTEIDWAYRTAAQDHLDGRSIAWPRGKVLGAPAVSTPWPT